MSGVEAGRHQREILLELEGLPVGDRSGELVVDGEPVTRAFALVLDFFQCGGETRVDETKFATPRFALGARLLFFGDVGHGRAIALE